MASCLFCQVTMIVMILDYHLSEIFTFSQRLSNVIEIVKIMVIAILFVCMGVFFSYSQDSSKSDLVTGVIKCHFLYTEQIF